MGHIMFTPLILIGLLRSHKLFSLLIKLKLLKQKNIRQSVYQNSIRGLKAQEYEYRE